MLCSLCCCRTALLCFFSRTLFLALSGPSSCFAAFFWVYGTLCFLVWQTVFFEVVSDKSCIHTDTHSTHSLKQMYIRNYFPRCSTRNFEFEIFSSIWWCAFVTIDIGLKMGWESEQATERTIKCVSGSKQVEELRMSCTWALCVLYSRFVYPYYHSNRSLPLTVLITTSTHFTRMLSSRLSTRKRETQRFDIAMVARWFKWFQYLYLHKWSAFPHWFSQWRTHAFNSCATLCVSVCLCVCVLIFIQRTQNNTQTTRHNHKCLLFVGHSNVFVDLHNFTVEYTRSTDKKFPLN